ncbi:MAG TPA: dipeptide ABC transporter ATP-binding protein [Casimicrobiaceae bacterium]
MLLEARDLVRHYRISRGYLRGHATVRALDGVSFTLDEGRTLAVVGESGCGKSTLARQVTMVETPTSGVLLLDGIDVAQSDAAQRGRLRPQVQMVFQNPYASLNPRRNVGALLEEPLVIHRRGAPKERRAAALAMMAKVGLRPEHYARYPHMFSGGQRQRIAVARALMLRPRLVVADEPISALDVSIQAQVLNLLLDLQQELRIAYLFIAHNLQVVRHIADTVMVMYAGRAVEQGPKAEIFARPRHPYTQALLASTPSLRRGRRDVRAAPAGEAPSPLAVQSGCAFRSRCPRAIERCAVEAPAPMAIGGVRVACHRAGEDE